MTVLVPEILFVLDCHQFFELNVETWSYTLSVGFALRSGDGEMNHGTVIANVAQLGVLAHASQDGGLIDY